MSHVVGPLGRGNVSDLTQIYQQKFGVGKKGTPWSRGYIRDQCCRGECGHGRAKLGVKEAKRMIPPSSFLERGRQFRGRETSGPCSKGDVDRGTETVQSYYWPSTILTSELYSLSISVTAG